MFSPYPVWYVFHSDRCFTRFLCVLAGPSQFCCCDFPTDFLQIPRRERNFLAPRGGRLDVEEFIGDLAFAEHGIIAVIDIEGITLKFQLSYGACHQIISGFRSVTLMICGGRSATRGLPSEK